MTVCKYRYKPSRYKFITTLYKITTTMLPEEVVPQRTYKTLETETPCEIFWNIELYLIPTNRISEKK